MFRPREPLPAATVEDALAIAVLTAMTVASTGCVRAYATHGVADAVSASGITYASDDDPELIAGAVPFGLKTMEGVLELQPEHSGLLLALTSGFTEYAFAFIEQPADEIADSSIDKATAMRKRARKLYLRARGYGFRGLEVAHPGFEKLWATDKEKALAALEKADVPILYWTAASWGLAIGAAKDDPEALADFPDVGRLAKRALALDEAWNRGTLHEFFITYEMSAPDGSPKSARAHFERAVALSEGKRAGPFVSMAESVVVKEQNVREFKALLGKALAIDTSEKTEDRLANVIMQRRARRLLNATGDLFLDDEGKS